MPLNIQECSKSVKNMKKPSGNINPERSYSWILFITQLGKGRGIDFHPFVSFKIST
jgi:hypothetical protein